MGHLIGPQHDSASLSLNGIWLPIIDSFVLFTLLTFRFSSKQLAFQTGMCTVQRHLLLVLLQVFIHASSVSCNSCFIEEVTECTRNSAAKRPFFFFLGQDDANAVYQCDKPHFSGAAMTNGRRIQPFDLSPKGLGENCDTFQYTFSKNTLRLALDQNPYSSREPTLTMEALNDKTWKVTIKKVIINHTTYDWKELEFRIGTKTELLVPDHITRPKDKGIYKCVIHTPSGEKMTITVPKLTDTNRNLVFVIGQDLPENVRISFSKADQKRQFHLGIKALSRIGKLRSSMKFLSKALIRIEITQNIS
ncbi:unnamed protein product [Albugo candida]|uniref:Uncharacterized protein n=1 Tax=Albugo candida TaxID=65357 RepID=A0A024GVV7_9STRA|nr:unnamed protein product [Albugo candida]|eukprot:CCI50607.1 unnamed protein product [Albugo candida]